MLSHGGGLKRVEYLHLDENLIGNRGACILAEQLPRLPNLRLVSLSGNRIGQIGMDALVAAKRRSERSTCMRDPNPASIARCYVTQ